MVSLLDAAAALGQSEGQFAMGSHKDQGGSSLC